VKRAIQIANALSDEVLALLRQTEIGKNQSQLQKLVELSQEEQLTALKAFVEGRAKNLQGAIDLSGEPKPLYNKDDRGMERFIAIWSAASVPLRKRIKNYIATNKDIFPVETATDEEDVA
jgi:hypothetical protein